MVVTVTFWVVKPYGLYTGIHVSETRTASVFRAK